MSRIFIVPAILALLVLPVTAQQGSGPGPTCDNPPCAQETPQGGQGNGPGGPGNGTADCPNNPTGTPGGGTGDCPYEPGTCPNCPNPDPNGTGPNGNGPNAGPGVTTPGVRQFRGPGRGPGIGGGGGRGGCTRSVLTELADLPVGTPDFTETAAVLRNREEEKLARDVYRELGRTWNLRVFDRIAGSEVHHMELVGLLIERYGLVDPIVDDTEGVFQDPELAALYTELVARGKTSPIEALKVGVMIEEMDLADLQASHTYTDDADFEVIFDRLIFATQNHLAAFQRQLGS